MHWELLKRAAISPGKISETVMNAARNLKEAADAAFAWLQNISEKILSNEIKPELHHHILTLLASQSAMRAEPALATFYAAIGELERATTPEKPKVLPVLPSAPIQESRRLVAPPSQTSEIQRSTEQSLRRPDVSPLTEPREFVKQFKNFYTENGLIEWGADVTTVAEKLSNLSAEKRAMIEKELSEGAIAILMPGREQQKKHLKKAIQQLKPIWIKDGQRQNVDQTEFWWDYVEKLVDNQDTSIFANVPETPYILLTKPTQSPDSQTCSKTVNEQRTLLRQYQQNNSDIHAMNIPGYTIMQAWHTANEFARNPQTREITPLDSSTYTRFIGIAVSGGGVAGGVFDSGDRRVGFRGSSAGDRDSRHGFRLEVRIPL
jgi:hypothetical protein